MIRSTIIYVYMLVACIFFSRCNKFLEEKSDRKLVVPGTLEDLQALLDDSSQRNSNFSSAGEVSADDYYLRLADFQALREDLRRMHTWEPDYIFQPTGNNDWLYCYEGVYNSSAVLDVLKQIPRSNQNSERWDNIKGQALSLRAYRYLDAVQIWCMPYDSQTAGTDLGVPLRLSADFNERSERVNLQEVYDRLINDLKESVTLLPAKNINASRPSKSMTYGLLARTYLNMRNYGQAGTYADSCLQLHNTLLDYNGLDATASFPFPRPLNDEIIFLAIPSSNAITVTQSRVLPEFYDSYDGNDLRKSLFFGRDASGLITFKGYYTGFQAMFGGLATDEMLLIRAECAARGGRTDQAMADLNRLLKTRWKTGTFIPRHAATPDEALQIILTERRKELIRRGLRWQDIRRLNKEGAGIMLTRNYDGLEYSLQPGDSRYALAIPEDVIQLSGIKQNPR